MISNPALYRPWLLLFVWLTTALPPANAIIVTMPGTEDLVDIEAPPSFVVAGKGVRHDLSPSYRYHNHGPGAPVYTYQCGVLGQFAIIGSPPPPELPPELHLSAEGVLEWIPPVEDAGTEVAMTIVVTVYNQLGTQVHQSFKSHTMVVKADLPALATPAPRVTYEGGPDLYEQVAFADPAPSIDDYEFFKWSLIGPPAGVYIDEYGYIIWPDSRGYARQEPYQFKIQADWETPSGTLTQVVDYTRYILPETATTDTADLEATVYTRNGGMLGHSVDAADGWLAAGEPFLADDYASNTGKVRVFKRGEDEKYREHLILQPEIAFGRDLFGTCVAMSSAADGGVTRLAVGAPEAAHYSTSGRTDMVGAVYVYVCTEAGVWQREATLEPPTVASDLKFGGWVDIQGDTLLASVAAYSEGELTTGALAVYKRVGGNWTLAQVLSAPAPELQDAFGSPAALDGKWLAASALKVDLGALTGVGSPQIFNDAGGVHMFEEVAGQYLHQQTIYPPTPATTGQFGQKLQVAGEWLFVSEYYRESTPGAVHVYKLGDGTWEFHQTLTSQFATSRSHFGTSISVLGDTLAVSAPGRLISTWLGEEPPGWSGITLFKLVEGNWEWQRQATERPHYSEAVWTWGHSIVQVSPTETVVGIPDDDGGFWQWMGGWLYLHKWPEPSVNSFAEFFGGNISAGDLAAKAEEDANLNGTSNLLEWMMGHDPTSMEPSVYRSMGTKPFLAPHTQEGALTFMVPTLVQGGAYNVEVQVSSDMTTWSTVEDARWGTGGLIPMEPGSGFNLVDFQPVYIPHTAMEDPENCYVRLKATLD